MSFDLEEKRLVEEIEKRKSKIVFLQLPEGLKPKAPYLASIIEKTGAICIVSTDPCYGACDLAISGAKILSADLIIHYAHSPITEDPEIPILYFEARVNINVKEVIMKTIPFLESWSKIGLVTTIQHVHQINEVKKILSNNRKTVFIGDNKQLKYPGQVIGCDFSNARSISEEVNAFLFVGGGKFHAIGIGLTTRKPVIIADPYENRIYSLQEEIMQLQKQRWASISEARNAKNFGVLINLKSGQMKMSYALNIRDRLRQKGLKVTLFALTEVLPSMLSQFLEIDAFVNTGCPRLSLDDAPKFSKPILSVNETLVLLGEMKWEELLKSGWLESEN